ncbi:AsmA-like C-terminal region-containing protein [Siccirubricoccus sp. G192]|nr:AsmA-like C-terminal region-containing protein [Siccirubricoccus sp. G192]
MIPDLPLPLEALRVTDSDLRWTVAEMVLRGVTWRQVEMALAIQDGRARLDPLAATLPGGRVTLRGAADVTTDPPTVQVAAQGSGLDLDALLGAFGVARRPSGRLDLNADLRGQGRGLRAVAAGSHGFLHLGLAEVRLPPGLLPAQLAQGVPLPVDNLTISGARAQFAVEAGIARTQVLDIATNLGRVTGEGTISLRDESLAIRLDTDLRLPIPGVPQGLRIRAPVPLTGTLGAPRLDWSRAEGSAAGAVAGEVLERSVPREFQAPAQELLRGLFGRGR